MSGTDPKRDLHDYLRAGREAVLWKLDGLGEYDARRPGTPTGTNLLGLVKHLAGVEIGYFGPTFGRPFADPPAFFTALDDPDADPTVDLWATAEETRAELVGLYHRAAAHTDACVAELPLEATGRVPWWPPERAEVTLHRILVHVATETHRHAGHADILREHLDGAVGLRRELDNMSPGDAAWWAAHRDRVEDAARRAETHSGATRS